MATFKFKNDAISRAGEQESHQLCGDAAKIPLKVERKLSEIQETAAKLPVDKGSGGKQCFVSLRVSSL